jgi:hypothetical protein
LLLATLSGYFLIRDGHLLLATLSGYFLIRDGH